jgi:type II secretory pathway component PulF
MSTPKTKTLFRDLATLINAGISPQQALKQLTLSGNPLWVKAENQVAKGKPLSNALYQNRLIGRYEKEILDVAEQAGRLPEGLMHIANQVEKREQRLSRLKSKLYYPFAVLVIAILVSSILQIVNHHTNFLSVFSKGILLLALAMIITRWIISVLNLDACQVLDKFQFLSSHSWYSLLFQQVVFGCLSWQIQSGIDFKTAFQRVSRLLNNKQLKQQLLKVAQHCGQGNSVAQSLAASELPINHDFQAILHSAEQSGEWSSAIRRALQLQQQELELRIQNLFDWAPRLYYGLVAVIAIGVIL